MQLASTVLKRGVCFPSSQKAVTSQKLSRGETSEKVLSSHFSAEQIRKFERVKDDKFLSKRFISHLFGDSFIQDTIYEGWFTGDALVHMISVLEKNEISKNVKNVREDLKKSLDWFLKIITYRNLLLINPNDDYLEPEIYTEELDEIDDDYEVEPPSDDDSNDQELNIEDTLDDKAINNADNEVNFTEVGAGASPMPELLEEFMDAVNSLSSGEKVLAPGGCMGHAVLYEFKKEEDQSLSFAVYNTGSGSEYHKAYSENEGSTKILGVYKITQINFEEISLSEFLTQLFNLLTEKNQHFGQKLYKELLPRLGGDIPMISTDPSDYMLMQRSGTCVWKMLSAYCHYNMPAIERKYIKLKARLDVFQSWYDLGHALNFTEISQNLLEKLIINHKFELFNGGLAPTNLTREELLVMGIYKVKKTFNRYKMLLSPQEIAKAEDWFYAFTGSTIHEA